MIDIVYAKMCEKAEEIQKKHKWNEGDFFIRVIEDEEILEAVGDIQYSEDNKLYDNNKFPSGIFVNDNKELEIKPKCWLPRQDQLQEIYRCNWLKENKRYQMQRYLIAFNDWWSKGRSSFINKEGLGTFFETFEQCGLAMIMKEMFNKTWNGEDWI